MKTNSTVFDGKPSTERCIFERVIFFDYVWPHHDLDLLNSEYNYTGVRKKSGIFVFEHNFTTTGSIFLQFSVTITEQLVYKYVILSKIYLA